MRVQGQGTAEDPLVVIDDDQSSLDVITQKPFRLLDLPPELWLHISKLIIHNSPRVAARSSRGYPPSRRHPPLQPGITRTCSLLRNELLPYYYQIRVSLEVSPFVSQVGQWLRNISLNNRKLIRGLRLSHQYRDWDATEQRLSEVWRVEFEIVRREGPINLRGKELEHEIRFL